MSKRHGASQRHKRRTGSTGQLRRMREEWGANRVTFVVMCHRCKGQQAVRGRGDRWAALRFEQVTHAEHEFVESLGWIAVEEGWECPRCLAS